jgi:hypothetical protein
MENHLIKFERCIFASLAIGIIVAALGMKSMTSDFGTAIAIAAFQVLILVIVLAIVLLITRKNSKIAKWVWLLFFLVGLVMYIPTLGSMFENGFIGILSAAQLLIQCLGTYFLFFGKDKVNNLST